MPVSSINDLFVLRFALLFYGYDGSCSFVHLVFWIFYLKLIAEKEHKRENREHTHIYHSANRWRERERGGEEGTKYANEIRKKHPVNVFLIIDR